MSEISDKREFELTGGAICLDFVNTVGDRPRSTEEKLTDYLDLVRWSRQAETIPAGASDRLEELAERHPRKSREALRRAIALRETLYRIFSRLAREEAPDGHDLRGLNSALPEAMKRLEIKERDGGFELGWAAEPPALDSVLWPVLRSAAELLVSPERDRVRECAAQTCSWLFIDRSRNRRRRWCDMATCGNRAKAKRHYALRCRASKV